MAIDEALLELARMPSIRFYRWGSPALSFGYFGRFSDVAGYAPARELIRRWTGGGIVLHGEDLTYSIVIPASDPVFGDSATSIYHEIHRALANVLIATGVCAELESLAAFYERRKPRKGDFQIVQSGTNCFESPVRADVMIHGRKVAGAAQRRTRRGLLQQGSVQGVDFRNGLPERFACALSGKRSHRTIDEEFLDRAHELAQTKYLTDGWLHRR